MSNFTTNLTGYIKYIKHFIIKSSSWKNPFSQSENIKCILKVKLWLIWFAKPTSSLYLSLSLSLSLSVPPFFLPSEAEINKSWWVSALNAHCLSWHLSKKWRRRRRYNQGKMKKKKNGLWPFIKLDCFNSNDLFLICYLKTFIQVSQKEQ